MLDDVPRCNADGFFSAQGAVGLISNMSQVFRAATHRYLTTANSSFSCWGGKQDSSWGEAGLLLSAKCKLSECAKFKLKSYSRMEKFETESHSTE